MPQLTGAELIAQERKEQIEKHNYTVQKDVEINQSEELAIAATALLNIDYPDDIIEGRPIGEFPANWANDMCKKMVSKNYKDRLVIAGALIAAEIDRLQAQNNCTA